jgi:hypothetical protein
MRTISLERSQANLGWLESWTAIEQQKQQINSQLSKFETNQTPKKQQQQTKQKHHGCNQDSFHVHLCLFPRPCFCWTRRQPGGRQQHAAGTLNTCLVTEIGKPGMTHARYPHCVLFLFLIGRFLR